jgi:hypothetical protein
MQMAKTTQTLAIGRRHRPIFADDGRVCGKFGGLRGFGRVVIREPELDRLRGHELSRDDKQKSATSRAPVVLKHA